MSCGIWQMMSERGRGGEEDARLCSRGQDLGPDVPRPPSSHGDCR